MNFDESYQYLLSLGNEVSAMKLGLESMTKLLRALGEPQKDYLKVQVAGTNGKGSVCAFVESICISANIKVGVTTSPHLISVTERVRVDGKSISDESFADLATRVRGTAERLVEAGELDIVPTYFEQVTAVALLAFAESKVRLAVLETGLGGRLDATTSAKADVAVITRIDLDHQQYLGDTIEQIAAEKAAIINERSAVVIGDQCDKAMRVITARCSEFNIKPLTVANIQIVRDAKGLGFRTAKNEYHIGKLGLAGDYQIENAATAILAAEDLSERFGIGKDEIEAGLAKARHPGRLELRGRYLFDGAHNIGGAKALRQFLDDEIDKPITLVFGAMKDKDVSDIAAILFHVAKTIIFTRPNNERAMDPGELESIAHRLSSAAPVVKTSSVAEALAKANELSTDDSVVLVTGSLYLVGEAQKVLRQQSKI